MAGDVLGITPYNPAVDVEFGRATSEGLMQLGAQLRSDMTAIQANRQVKTLGAQLSQLDPKSDAFPSQLMQAAVANPLGAMHPVGKIAIDTLGAAHKQWIDSMKTKDVGGTLYDPRTGTFTSPPSKASTAMPYSTMAGGDVLNRQTGTVTRNPNPNPPAQTPEQKAFAEEKARLDKALLNSETSLREAAGGEDVAQLATASKVYRVKADGKTQDNNGENVILEFPDGSKKQLTWKDFSKIHGHYTALENLRSQRAALQPPAMPDPSTVPSGPAVMSGKLSSANRAALQDALPAAGTTAALFPVSADLSALAQKALDDPSATEAHKSAARKILGLE